MDAEIMKARLDEIDAESDDSRREALLSDLVGDVLNEAETATRKFQRALDTYKRAYE